MNTISVEDLLERYRSGYSLEQPFYTDLQLFDLEWEHIWKKYWLFAGTTAEIPEPEIILCSGFAMILLLLSGE
jgi:Rieske 2Fe-2S family protein